MDGFDPGHSLESGLDQITNFIPQVLGALLILLIGWIISKVVANIVRKALRKVRFDRALHTSQAGNYIARVLESPTNFVAKSTYWLIFFAFITMAVSALNLPLLNQILTGVYGYIPRVIAAVIIFIVASGVSAGSAAFVQRVMGKTATARLIMTVIPAVTMSLAAFMILNQLNVARDIVNILFTALVGSIALGSALAFGLGGRDAAKALIEQAVDTARDNSAQTKADFRRASTNTQREAERAKSNLD